MIRVVLAVLLWALTSSLANAQAPTKLCFTTNGTNCIEATPDNPYPVIQSGASYLNIAAGVTNTVKTGKGQLIAIINNKAVVSTTITIYDNTAASGTKIGTITNPGTLLQSQYSLYYSGLEFATGLTIVTSGADDLTVVYK